MWIILSLVCALSLATSDLFCKIALKDRDPLMVAWARILFSAPMLLIFLPCSTPPQDFLLFGALVLFLLPLEILALLLYMKALKRSPLSMTLPFLAFTPIFILFTGLLFLGEKPGFGGVCGVLFIAGGAYILSSQRGQAGLLSPVRNFVRERGAVLMLAVALIYSVTAPLGKKCILISSPLFMAATYFSLIAVSLTIWNCCKYGRKELKLLFGKQIFWLIGLAQAVMVLSHVYAISMGPAAYMIAVKRTSMLFGVIYGLAIFKEGEARYRLPGSLLMVVGVFTLSLST